MVVNKNHFDKLIEAMVKEILPGHDAEYETI